MSFVMRCLAVENPKKPFHTRCKKSPGKNGIVCDEHMVKARKGAIHVLMHHDVSKTFGIPFKNQITVQIDLSKGKKDKKPVSVNAQEEKVRHTKNHLREQMQDLSLEELKMYHDELKLNVWEEYKKNKNEYAFKYHIVKIIIDTFLSVSVKK
jgi:hypothetical protein